MDLFIAEFRFAKNFWFELELHEFLNAFALDQDLRPFLVNRDTQLVFLRKKNRPLFWRKLESEFLE